MKASATLALLTLIAVCVCKKSPDQDLIAAAALGGSYTRTLGAAQRTGGTGAVAALSAAGSGLNTGAVAFLPRHLQKDRMLLAIRDKLRSRGMPRALARAHKRPLAFGRRSPVRPAAFTCAGAPANDCSQATDFTDYQLQGTETCEDGTGTADAQPPQNAGGVDVYLQDNDGLLEYYVDGYFRFTNCGTFSVEFNNFPNYEMNFISGDLYTSGYMASTETETPNTISGFFFAETEISTTSSDNFRVDGGSAMVMDLFVTESEAASIFFDANTGDILSGFASGTITLSGTIDGQAVNFSGTYNENLAE